MPVQTRLLIRAAATGDSARIIGALAPAVASSEVARWLFPNANSRGRLVRDRVGALISGQEGLVGISVVEVGRQILGATVWTTCATDPGVGRSAAAVDHHDPDCRRLRHLERRLAQRHPRTAHEHLLLLGVIPAYQRLGIGAALLADWHSWPRPAAPRYLLAGDTLIPLAVRFGYHVVGQRISAGLGAPALSVMWRPGLQDDDPAPACEDTKEPTRP